MKRFCSFWLVLLNFVSLAQEKSPLTLNGYIEVYYGKDFANPTQNTRPSFLYNHTRVNEVAPNLALLKASYSQVQVRANLALMAGTYAQYNLAAEPELLRAIYEANVGIKLSRQRDLWLDAGVFSSHIGFESAIGKDCWTLTRSLAAENSPYYESGVKLSYLSPNGKWLLAGFVLNGWQRIKRVDGNTSLNIGTQIQYKPSATITLNSSTFLGNDKPDLDQRNRYFHDFYEQFQLSQQTGAMVGFDIGWEQQAKGSNAYSHWITPVVIVQQKLSPNWSLSGRWEYYQDTKGVIVSTNTPNGFQTVGYSINVDFSPFDKVLCRLEAKQYQSKDAIFDGKSTNTALTTSLALSF
ncbi:MAG: porin [Spirosomataceae bacterium]